MDVLELVIKPVDPIAATLPLSALKVVAYACGKCRIVAHSRVAAEDCCSSWACKTCGAETPRYSDSCRPCADKKSREEREAREKAQFEKAKKVHYKDYDGDCIYFDEAEEHGYMFSIHDLYDYCYEREWDVPLYVWGTSITKLSLDAQDIIDRELESGDHHENAMREVTDVDKLQTLLDLWCDTQKIQSYWPDESIAVLIPPDPDNVQGCGGQGLDGKNFYVCTGCRHEYTPESKDWVNGALVCPKCKRTEGRRS